MEEVLVVRLVLDVADGRLRCEDLEGQTCTCYMCMHMGMYMDMCTCMCEDMCEDLEGNSHTR